MINWLKKPYLLVTDIKFNLIISFIIGCFIFLFLYTFQPFGIHDMKNNPLMYTLGFGIVAFLSQIFILIVVPRIFRNTFKDENWTVGKNIIYLTVLVLFIAVLNWFYNKNVQIVSDESPLISFNKMISYTFTIGVFPILLFTFFAEKFHRERRLKNSENIMKQKTSLSDVLNTKKKITVYGNNKQESLSFYLNDLVYISSQSNYACFFINTNNEIKEHVLRNTLTKIIEILGENKNIIRCHKSYIINSNYMNSICGNARGYYLTSSKLIKKIPVSRKFNKEELKNLIN